MKAKTISERSLCILKLIVAKYIREGNPVASKSLAKATDVALSSASIRNIMADLEEAGYLQSPHTSAGRIPTVQGYRLFVNDLLTVSPLQANSVEIFHDKLDPNASPQALVESASALLSSLTQLAGVVTLPRRERNILRQVEFLPLSNCRVLVILVVNESEVQNRIIHTDRAFKASELKQAANFLTATYAGKDLLEMRQALLGAMRDDQEHMKQMMQTVIDVAEKTFEQDIADDYVIAGESNLLDIVEEAGVNRLRSLFEAFTQKQTILHLLDSCLQSDGVQIFIGEESGYEMLDNCSLVTASYSVNGKLVGALGVIGPTRMAYERVISAVDVTARLLSVALGEKQSE